MTVQDDRPRGLQRGLTRYGDEDFSIYLRRAFARSMGLTRGELEKPIIGITNTYSGFNNCHRNVPELIDTVKRGVTEAGGLPLEFPTISLGEIFLSPTSMMFRNLMAMETEEMIRAQPMDGVVLIGGCDKTVPAQLMAAASAGIPAIQLVTGAMMASSYRGTRLGACTDCRRFWSAYRGGRLHGDQIQEVESTLCTTAGTCMVMGTASTMACISEALGMMLAGGATPPAVASERLRHAYRTGKEILRMVHNRITPDKVMTADAFYNAICVLMAIGGSTNAVIHLTAIARRLGITLDLPLFQRISDRTPVLVDLKPTGSGYMEDLDRAGGMGAILKEMEPLLKRQAVNVQGMTMENRLQREKGAQPWQHVIRSRGNPLRTSGAIATLHGNLAPHGAILKRSAATKELMKHRGPAVVFESLEDLARRVDDPSLDVTKDHVLVLQHAGPLGGPGMPEAGYLPIPKKLLREGVKDMVRISDARMSGTAFGTVVLHVSPEAAAGGPLALVKTGDWICMDVHEGKLDLEVPDDVLKSRRKHWKPDVTKPLRGYAGLFHEHVLQAHQGCDFSFL